MSSYEIRSLQSGLILILDRITGRRALYTRDGRHCQGALVLSWRELNRLLNRVS